MIKKRCFLQWFLLLLSYITVAYFCCMFRVPQTVFHTDITYMTSVIAFTFVVSIGYLGFASWRFDPVYKDDEQMWAIDQHMLQERAYADTALGRSAAFIVTLIGLLGTAIGLMLQVRAMGAVDIADAGSVVQFIGTIGVALSTALYATASGIIACIGITVMNSNLEYFLDRESAV